MISERDIEYPLPYLVPKGNKKAGGRDTGQTETTTTGP